MDKLITLRFSHFPSGTPVTEVKISQSATILELRHAVEAHLMTASTCPLRYFTGWYLDPSTTTGKRVSVSESDPLANLLLVGIDDEVMLQLEGPLVGDEKELSDSALKAKAIAHQQQREMQALKELRARRVQIDMMRDHIGEITARARADVYLLKYPDPMQTLWQILTDGVLTDTSVAMALAKHPSCGLEKALTNQQFSQPPLSVSTGATPIMLAALANRLDVVRELAKEGANINAKASPPGQRQGYQSQPIVPDIDALQLAILHDNPQMVACLIDKGSDLSVSYWWTSPQGTRVQLSPLHFAITNKKLEAVRAIVTYVDADELCALHLASDVGSLPIVNLLISHGSKVDAINEEGKTALHVAADRGHTAVLRRLVEAGSDYTISDAKGENALSAARLAQARGLFAMPGEWNEVQRLLTEGIIQY